MRPDPRRDLCLALLRIEPPGPRLAAARELLGEIPPGRFLAYLQAHRVDQLWLRAALDLGWRDLLPDELMAGLEAARRTVAGVGLLQRRAAGRAAHALDGAGVPYVFFKGYQLGGELYGDALLRPASDVDLLISEADREPAFAALRSTGFEPAPEVGQPPYQLTFAGHHAALDLHWQPWAPERSRESFGPFLLAGRRRRGGEWFPGVEATLALLALSSAITDHVTARLVNAVDLDRFLRRHRDFDPRRICDLLERTGLRAAAWAMLHWTGGLLDTPVPRELDRRLAPGPLRRRYLRAWLERDPAGLYPRFPVWVRGGFSLFLHDRPADALRAAAGVLRRRRTRQRPEPASRTTSPTGRPST